MLYICSLILALIIYKLKIIRSTISCFGCGLFGFSGKTPVDPVLLRWLAYENQARGDDSTGVYGNDHVAKSPVSARNFVFTKEFYDATDNATMIIGHTRKATMGAKTKENAHPFEFFKSDKHTDPDVVGTHNGQIFEYVWKKLCKDYNLTEPEVDSKIIYQLMQALNFDYDEVLSKIDGAMALAWTRPEFNSEKSGKYLYLYRRLSRPLHVGFIGTSMYYSSESEPLYLIGCDSIDALATDTIYTFKNGGLLGVSPVKKPRIVTIKADQTLLNWQTTTATEEEKTALGICGVAAQNQMSVWKSPNKQHNSHRRGMTDGGQSNGFSENNKGGLVPGGQLLLLQNFDTEPYRYESTLSPARGKFYASGNNSCCYLIFQLSDTRDKLLNLPMWLVRSHHDYTTYSLTAHNGIGIIEVPLSMCGKPMELDIINPLQPNVVYKTSIDRPIAGRVLEVALFIPFPSSEEKNSPSEEKNVVRFIDLSNTNEPKRQNRGINSISDWLAFTKNGGKNEGVLRFEPIFVSDGPRERVGSLLFPTRPPTIGFQQSAREAGNEGRCNLEVGVLNVDYDKETDILGMDVYTTSCNLDELKLHLDKISECEAAIDRTANNDPMQVLSSIEPFLEFLKDYFESRLKQLTNEEVEDALNTRNNGCS